MNINFDLLKKITEEKRPCINQELLDEIVLTASRVNNGTITLNQANAYLLKKEVYMLALMQTGKVLFQYKGYNWMSYCSPNPQFVGIKNNNDCELIKLTKKYTKKSL